MLSRLMSTFMSGLQNLTDAAKVRKIRLGDWSFKTAKNAMPEALREKSSLVL